MAAELIIDTLKLASRLEHEAGVDARFAAVLSSGLADELGERLATKADLEREIRGVRTDLGGEIQSLRGELRISTHSLRADLEAQVQSLRADLEAKIQSVRFDLGAEIQDLRAEVRVLGWMMKTTLAGVAALLAMVIPIVLKTLHGI